MTTCEEWYIELHSKCKENILQTFKYDTSAAHARAHNLINDLGKWIEILENRPEIGLLNCALREYQFCLLAIVQGQYRQAYMGLRVYLEQALAAVYFSANEFELRLWIIGQRDIVWQRILDSENGIFSKNFIDAFGAPLIDERSLYQNMASTLYRECSEFIHGNYQTQSKLENNLDFKNEIFDDWHDKAETARLIVMFALSARYLSFLNESSKAALESIVIDYLGHIPQIVTFF